MGTNITILTEAGMNIGFGHYTRCSSLLKELHQSGCSARMFVHLNQFSLKELKDASPIVRNWLEDVDEIKPETANEIVVVDSYLAGADIYSKLQMRFRSVVAIDDYNRISYQAALVINPNVFFKDLDYSNQTAACIGGKDFVMLRKEFRENKPSKHIGTDVETILITLGGTDFRLLLPRIMRICVETKARQILVIDPEGLAHGVADNRIVILPTQEADGMKKVMMSADLVISACGQTLHELVALGKPTLGICLDIDQLPNQKYYLKSGFLLHDLIWNEAGFDQKLKLGITDFQPKNLRISITEIAKTLINKNGVENIVKAITSLEHELA